MGLFQKRVLHVGPTPEPPPTPTSQLPPAPKLPEAELAAIRRCERHAKSFWEVGVRNNLCLGDMTTIMVLMVASVKKVIMRRGDTAEWMDVRDKIIKAVREV